MPATLFAEPDKTTSKGNMMWRWFSRADGLPFCFAKFGGGDQRPWDEKAPSVRDHSCVVEPVHDTATPVTLMTAENVDRRLTGRSVEDCRLAALEGGPIRSRRNR